MAEDVLKEDGEQKPARYEWHIEEDPHTRQSPESYAPEGIVPSKDYETKRDAKDAARALSTVFDLSLGWLRAALFFEQPQSVQTQNKGASIDSNSAQADYGNASTTMDGSSEGASNAKMGFLHAAYVAGNSVGMPPRDGGAQKLKPKPEKIPDHFGSDDVMASLLSDFTGEQERSFTYRYGTDGEVRMPVTPKNVTVMQEAIDLATNDVRIAKTQGMVKGFDAIMAKVMLRHVALNGDDVVKRSVTNGTKLVTRFTEDDIESATPILGGQEVKEEPRSGLNGAKPAGEAVRSKP